MSRDLVQQPASPDSVAQQSGGIFSDAIYVAIEGNAELIRDKAIFKAHWTSGLDRWFDKGVDTPNIVLIKVKANRITYWDGEEEGEVQV